MLGAEIVRGKQVERSRQRPEARLELAPVGALQPVVPLAGIALEQDRDVRPPTSLALGHRGERSGERTVGTPELSGGVICVAGEGRAPIHLSATLARGVRAFLRAIVLDQVANALPSDPAVA